jgi:hypothetical protein
MRRRRSGVGGVQDLHWVPRDDGAPGEQQAAAELHQAARISRRDDRGPRGLNMRELGREDRGGDLGLRQVEDSCASAALVAGLEWPKFDAADCSQNLQRRLDDALCVLEVTGRVPSDTRRHLVSD